VVPLDPRRPAPRLGRREEALAAYRRALELTKADAERRFLERRMEGCS
jgi:predicted RNA polymerase sigma factor